MMLFAFAVLSSALLVSGESVSELTDASFQAELESMETALGKYTSNITV
jgi:hypothetical protein